MSSPPATANSKAPGSLVLLYHRMGTPLRRSIVRGQYTTPGCLRWQIHTLARLGYHPAPLSAVLPPSMSEGRFAVTFDDGYAAVGRIAWPLLLELQVPMTLFVVAGAIGQSNHWDQAQGDCLEPMADAVLLRELADAGVEIGSHTMSHARLTACSNAELHTEIVDAKQKLEDLLGRPVPGFSYPYGAWDARVRAAVIDAGYRYATATILGPVATDTDPYLIPRVNMRWNTVGWLLQRKIRKAYRQGGA